MSCYVKDEPRFLKEALDSVISQDFLPTELVLVCDGVLTEYLNEVIDHFSNSIPHLGVDLKIIRLDQNIGLGKALAIGAKECSQPYIVRMDSDDISIKTRLRDLKEAIDLDSSADVIGAQIEEFHLKLGDLGRVRQVPQKPTDIRRFARFRSPMNHVTVCIKRSTLEEVGGYEHMLWHEDYFLWLKMLNAGAKLLNLPVVHVWVRVVDLTARRSGFKYVRAEFDFVRSNLRRGYMSVSVGLLFIFSRLLVRLAPSFFVRNVYGFLRYKK